MYLRDYSKDDIDKNEKIIIPIIEKMLKLLIDRESEAKVLTILESITQVFKAFQKKIKRSKKRCSLSKRRRKHYIHCLNDKYDNFFYWYICLELVLESFYKYYTSTE